MTHVKKTGIKVGNPVQVFAHHSATAEVPDGVTWAAGDVIDIFNSLGTAASKLKIIMRGSIEIVIRFNDLQPMVTYNPTGPDTVSYVSQNAVSNLRLFNSSGTQVFEFDNMGIRDITIVYAGAATSSNFVEIVAAA